MEINFTGLIGQQQSTQSDAASLANDFDDFLTLLTTQLQNQDPLEPMDSTEFTNQLVAFAEVEQQINSNAKLDTLNGLSSASVFSSALNYIGLDVSYVGNEVYFDGTTPTTISYGLESQAVDATLFVRNAAGEIVFSQDLPANDLSGEIAWAGTRNGGGTADAGTYAVSVEAVGPDGEPVEASTVVRGRVSGVEMQGTTLTAIVGERAVPVGSILNAKMPAQPESQT